MSIRTSRVESSEVEHGAEEHAARVALLEESELFRVLSEPEIDKLADLLREVVVRPGGLVVREGDPSGEMLLLAEGELQVLKRESEGVHSHEITRLGAGVTIGELALIDPSPRSASVQAVKTSRLYAVSTEDMWKLSSDQATRTEILTRLSQELLRRLHYANEVTVNVLQMRVAMGRLLIAIIFCLSLYAFVLRVLEQYEKQTSILTLAISVGVAGSLLIIMGRSGYPMRFYGLRLENWRRVAVESVLYSLPVCVLYVAMKWLLIRNAPALQGQVLFDAPVFAVAAGSFSLPHLFFNGLLG